MDISKKKQRSHHSMMPNDMEMNERRDFYRTPIRGRVMLRIKTPPGTIYDADLVDVSASGVNVVLTDTIPIGTEVQLAVKFADQNEHFFVSGIVARSDDLDAPPEGQCIQLGVELRYEKHNVDFHDWRALFIA